MNITDVYAANRGMLWRSRPPRTGEAAEISRRGSEEWEERRFTPCTLLELRRGVRSTGFLVCFGLMQLVGIIAMLAPFYGAPDVPPPPGHRGGLMYSHEFSWMLISGLGSRLILPGLGIVFFVALPVCAYLDFNADNRRNLLEPLFMTRIHPGDVVAGKWVAINFQIALVAITLLPALTLRYYRGGGNFLQEMILLGDVAFASSMLCGFALVLAAEHRFFHRLTTVLGIVCLLAVSLAGMLSISVQLAAANGATFLGIALPLCLGYVGWSALCGCIRTTATSSLERSCMREESAQLIAELTNSQIDPHRTETDPAPGRP